MGQVTGNPEWKDYPDESTPVTAQALNGLESAVDSKRYSNVTINSNQVYNVTVADLGGLVVYDSASAGQIVLPNESDTTVPIGSWIDFTAIGAGLITVIASGNVQLLTTKTAVLKETNAIASIIRIAADKWMVVGSLA